MKNAGRIFPSGVFCGLLSGTGGIWLRRLLAERVARGEALVCCTHNTM